jgi:hypothetical protein
MASDKEYQKLAGLRKTIVGVLEALDEMIKANAPATNEKPQQRRNSKADRMLDLTLEGWRKPKSLRKTK